MLSIVLAAALLAPPQVVITPPKRVGGRPDEAPSTQNIRGTLRTVEEKSIVVEDPDQRIITVSISEKTFFVQAGRGISLLEFQTGDSLEIEALQDREGRYQAMIVKLLARGRGRASSGDAPSRPRAAAKSDNEEGPPVLRRGAPPPHPSRPVPVSKTADDVAPAAVPEKRTAPVDPRMALLEQARSAAGSFIESLPNYLCQQVTTRSVARTANRFEAQDVVTANVVYENHQESYRDIKVNGKPMGKSMMDIGGASSTGEFGTILIGLFHPATAADFRFNKNSTASGRVAAVYDYEVARENSSWHVSVPGQEIVPAYRGAVWIDKETARVLRIEMEAVAIPKSFPMDHVESAVDYATVRLETQTYLLPVHAENLMCERDSSICSKNVIDFRNYRKFSADSKIVFDPK